MREGMIFRLVDSWVAETACLVAVEEHRLTVEFTQRGSFWQVIVPRHSVEEDVAAGRWIEEV